VWILEEEIQILVQELELGEELKYQKKLWIIEEVGLSGEEIWIVDEVW